MSNHPHLVNIANNPNINRDPPPPPLSAPPTAAQPNPGPQQVVVEQQHQQAPIYGPPLPIGIGGAPIGVGVGVGIGAYPHIVSTAVAHVPPIGVPAAMDPALFGMCHGMQGPLAPIQTGNFLPGAHHGIGYGLHGAAGVAYPPPPPGAAAGVIPPFAPTVPLWSSGGLAFGNVPTAGAVGMGGVVASGVMPAMVGVGLGGNTMHNRPAPMVQDGNMGYPAQPEQQEVTQISGGIPPGVTLIESPEHTIAINIKGNACPWLSPGASFITEPLAFSSSTGLNRVIQVCNGGLSVDDCENMAITECIELGNGMWEKGQTFKYNDAVSRVLTMKDAGWDNKRNRVGGQSLHIWGHRL